MKDTITIQIITYIPAVILVSILVFNLLILFANIKIPQREKAEALFWWFSYFFSVFKLIYLGVTGLEIYVCFAIIGISFILFPVKLLIWTKKEKATIKSFLKQKHIIVLLLTFIFYFLFNILIWVVLPSAVQILNFR